MRLKREVFGLPGFEKERGRYLLSLTNAAQAVGKAPQSISDFLVSNAFKALFNKASEFQTFVVENAQKGIVGILSVKNLIWRSQLFTFSGVTFCIYTFHARHHHAIERSPSHEVEGAINGGTSPFWVNS